MTLGSTKISKSKKNPSEPITAIVSPDDIVLTPWVQQSPVSKEIEEALYSIAFDNIPSGIVALDNGQGRWKVACQLKDGTYAKYDIPSLLANKRFVRNGIAQGTARKNVNETSSDESDPSTYYLSYNGKHIAFGRDAAATGSTSINDRYRYLGEQMRAGILAAGIWFMKKMYPGKTTGIIFLSTHIPMDIFDINQDVMKTHTGDYVVVHHDVHDDVEYHLKFVITNVDIEGLGATVSCAPDVDGDMTTTDIGEGTLDCLYYPSGSNSADDDLSFFRNIGVTTLREYLNGRILDLYGRKLNPIEMMRCLDSHKQLVVEHGYHIADEDVLLPPKDSDEFSKMPTKVRHTIQANREIIESLYPSIYVVQSDGTPKMMDRVQLYLLLREEGIHLGEEIFSIIRGEWAKGTKGKIGEGMVGNVYVGGCVYFIRLSIEKYMKNYIIPEFPEYANVLGLLLLAISRYKKNIGVCLTLPVESKN